MSKKSIIITIILIVIISLGFFAYFFLLPQNGNVSESILKFKQFMPFGDSGITEISTTTPEIIIDNNNQTPNYTQKLRKIWSEPVAGAGIMDLKAGSVVRFIEKATGHIYETELFSPNQTRISNTTIPLVYNAVWQSKLNSVVIEQLSEDEQSINIYLITIKTGTTTENNVSGSLLSDNISDISGVNGSLFYMQKLNSGSVGFISNIGTNKSKQIWASPIKEMLSQFVNEKTVALTTKPHENSVGLLYFVNTSNNQIKKILGDIYGLSTLVNSSAEKVLYLSQDNNIELNLFDIKNQTKTPVSPTTFPEKCVWSKKDLNIIYCAIPESSINRNSLTNWYMGKISFNDNIWKIDIKNNTSNILSNLREDGGEDIDLIKPILSDNEQYIIFINKKNNSLWSLDLTK